MPSRRFVPRLLALLLPLVFAVAANAQTSLFDETWTKVKRHFYDRDLHGVDWEEVRDRYRPEVEVAESREEEVGIVRRMLGELGASHTALIDAEVYHDHFENEMTGAQRLQAGIEIAHTEEGWFVTGVLESSHAAEAGVRKGDRVLRIDGDRPQDSALLVDAGGDTGIPGDPHFFLRLPEEGEYRLTLQSERKGKTRRIAFAPTRTSMIAASAASVRVIEERGERLGYIHLWHFLNHAIADEFDRALVGPLADCDGLILDVRGRGGSVWVLERVLSRLRASKPSWFRRSRSWKKPVVLLIDENSRSAKEIFAYKFKRERLGPVVGRKTPGAVLGSTFFKLRDGSVLLLPIMDARVLNGGVALEGVGVEPTVPVEEPDRWTEGCDPILEEGLRQVVGQVRLRRAI